MTTLSKNLLAVSVVGIVTGIIVDFGGLTFSPTWTVALPAGAILSELFIISLLLGKVTAEYDAEEARKMKLIQTQVGNTTPVSQDHPAGLPAHG